MKLSIITINYNNVEGLKKTLYSVVKQSFTDYEYIVIDGGSTDGSIDVIKKYENKITYWVSEPDNGIYNAMNKGIKKANGEYLQFLNSGDWLCDNMVFENIFNNKVDYDLILGNMIKVYENNLFVTDKGPENNEITLKTMYHGTINHSCSFIKSKLFKKYGLYDESFKIVSDWKFYLIAFGLNNSKVIYKDIDVNYFDMTGISNSQMHLRKLERETIIFNSIPTPILTDYKNMELIEDKLNIINSHLIVKKVHRFLEIILIRISKILNLLSTK